MAYKTIKRVSVPNLKSFGLTKTELQVKEAGEFSVMLNSMGKWAGSVLLPFLVKQFALCKGQLITKTCIESM